MAVTRTQTFRPAKISVARAAAPVSLSGSQARTAPVPTRRTTTPARRSNVAAQLAALNRPSGGAVGQLHPLVASHGPEQRSILGQFWDLAKNLPQGLVGFGKDILTDVTVVPHLAIDVARGDIGSPNDYLPAAGGMITSFGRTGYDITHPQEFIDAYNRGEIVGKVVEDVGNIAIAAGGVSKAIGAGAATGVMSAQEAAVAAKGGLSLTGRSLEEAAAAGVSVPKNLPLAEAGQFGGRELAEYAIPKPRLSLAGVAERTGNPELAGQLQRAGNVVRQVGHLGERAGNLPAAPYMYAGRGINRLAEAAGIEGGVSGAIRRGAARIAPEVAFRGTAAGQTTRTAMAEAERVGTRSTRFVLGAERLAQELKLSPEESSAVLSMIDTPNLGMGLEHLDDTQMAEYLDRAYRGVEADQRPTIGLVRKVQQYRDRTLPPEKLAAMDRVTDEQTGIAQDRTQRMLGPEPAKLEPGTPAEAPAAVPHLVAGEPPGVVPGRPIVGVTPTGLHPEQLGNEIRGTQEAEYIQTQEKRRNIVQRQAEKVQEEALRKTRIYDAQAAVNDTIPPPPDPTTEFGKGVRRTRVSGADSIARRRYDQAQRQLEGSLNDYVRLSEGGPSPAVEAAGREVERLTLEVERVRGIVERNVRRVDAATALSRVGPLEAPPSELGQVAAPEVGAVPRGEAQSIRAHAQQLGDEAAFQSHGEIEQMTGGERPSLPAKGQVGGEYDWFYELDAPTRRRLQNEGWMPGRTRPRKNPVTGKIEREPVTVVTPNVVTEAINRNLGTNLSTDEAMRRYVEAVRRHWDDKSGKSQAIIDQVAQERQMPRERVAAAVRGRIADYGALVTDHVTSTFQELRTAFQEMNPEQAASLNSDVNAMLDDPAATVGDFGDLLESNFPNLDVTSPEGVMSMLEGMTDMRAVVDWMRNPETTVFPERLRVKAVARGEAASRSLGRLEGTVTGARAQATSAEAGLRRSEQALATAQGAQERNIATAGRRVERAATAEEAARPAQGPKLAETLKPDTAAYAPYRRRIGTTKTGEKTTPMSPMDRARVRQGELRNEAMRTRAKANKLRKSVQRYDEKIAQARNELSRTFQERMHTDTNLPAAAQLRSAVASGGKALGNITGTGDSAALNGVIANIGDRYGMYDDLVEVLDEATVNKGEALSAAEVAQHVDDVLRARPDVELNVQHRTLLDDAIGRDTLLEDMNDVMTTEVDGGRRLNSPYRLMDVIDAHGWNMPAEARAKVRAAFDRYQVRRANTIHKIYNQWSAAVPARFRPAVQAGQRQIGALIDMAEAHNAKIPGGGDIYLDMAESTMSTLGDMVEANFDPVHLTGGRPAAQTSAASAATGGGLGQTKTRGQRTRRTGLRQLNIADYARVEAQEATTWIRNQRNAYLEQQLGKRADSIPEVQEALATWAEEHHGEIMPPRTLAKIAAESEGGGYVPISDVDVSPQTMLVPKRVYDVLTPTRYNNVALKALSRTNRAFKTWVLPFSPKWQIGNVLGNVIQAWVHGGVSPLELLAQMNRIRRYEGGIVRLWQKAGLPEWSRAEIANHGLTMDEYRTLRDLDDKPPRTPIGKIARASFRLNEFVDNLTRSSVDLAALRRGESSEAALQTTVRTLGDYSRMSTFERKVVREIIPFYAWIRHSTIATLRLPIVSPTRAAFLFHLADIYRDPQAQGELFGSRLELGAGLLNLGTINPLQNVTSLIAPGELIGPNISPTLKAISGIGLGLDLSKMAAITRPQSTAMLDPYGRPKTTAPITQLIRNPLAGAKEIGWQLTQQAPTAIRSVRDIALGDQVRYGGTGYPVGTLQDPRKRSISTLLRALNLPTLDQPPDTRSS